MSEDLTAEKRLELAEDGAGVREITPVNAEQEASEPTSDELVSGGPLDDELSAEALEGDEDLQVEQDQTYVEEEGDETE